MTFICVPSGIAFGAGRGPGSGANDTRGSPQFGAGGAGATVVGAVVGDDDDLPVLPESQAARPRTAQHAVTTTAVRRIIGTPVIVAQCRVGRRPRRRDRRGAA